MAASKLYELKKTVGDYGVIGIDEGQFVSSLVPFMLNGFGL